MKKPGIIELHEMLKNNETIYLQEGQLLVNKIN